MVLGVIFLIVPGPSLLFFIPGLWLLSYEYTWAKPWLRKCMTIMKRSAQWLDKQIRKRRYP